MKSGQHILGLILIATFLFSASSVRPLKESHSFTPYEKADSLPEVFPGDKADLLHGKMRHEVLLKSKSHQIPGSLGDWKMKRKQLREDVIAHAGVQFFPGLKSDMRETRTLKKKGYSIKMIYFQTRPGIYATANLYIPDGPGPFPAVVLMMGHSNNGKLYENYQSVGHSLALDGYVALAVDPWGAGERTSVPGESEYHGSNIGASLLNVGETLLGMQLTDNIRAVDLLSSLPYVDKGKIGATGASGGGNQTMWLAAIDERVKAAMPVVSVGTFESYIMAHNCVCEVLPSGLEFTEEWGILGLVAPRAIKMCNHKKESNPTFFPAEMLKSYEKARHIFDMYGVKSNITYEFFDRPHGYYPEDREALLGWLGFHLKGAGNGVAIKEKPFEVVPTEDLTVFPDNKRDALVQSTAVFCKATGTGLRTRYLASDLSNKEAQKRALRKVLKIEKTPNLIKAHHYGQNGIWTRTALEVEGGSMIPVLLKSPEPGKSQSYAIIAHSEGKNAISRTLIDQLIKEGKGVAIVDLSGTGEARSFDVDGYDKMTRLHTYGRAQWWLGGTVLGNWANELECVAGWLNKSHKATSVAFHGYKESALAGLFMSALGSRTQSVYLYQAPLSYLFDTSKDLSFLGLGVHVPGILKWGDVSLAAALSANAIYIKNPVTMSGRPLDESEISQFKAEFERVRGKTGVAGKTYF